MAVTSPSVTTPILQNPPAPAAAGDSFTINRLTTADLKEAVRKGIEDFKALPSHLIFLAVIYPLGAFILAQLTYNFDLLPLFFPLVAGFAILGPFVAIGLYEISRRREQGLEVHWRDVSDVWHSQSRGSILFVGFLLLVIFAAWMTAANMLYIRVMGAGSDPQSVSAFLRAVLTTSEGWTLIVVGHAVGFVFAALAYMLSAVSFPLLLDRPVGAGTAIRASFQTVTRNPGIMILWAAVIAAGLMIGSALLFVGLVLVLPVLAHASWHLYRRAVQWE
jgi:uncharacterized membrane protein